MILASGHAMGTIISTRETQFSYFDQLLGGPNWKGSKILDFGGNVGGFLAGAGEGVERKDCWCRDLTGEVWELGGRACPPAHFAHSDRYGAQYTPEGIRPLPI